MGDIIEGPDKVVEFNMPGKTEPGISNKKNYVADITIMGIVFVLAVWMVYYAGAAVWDSIGAGAPPREPTPFDRHQIVKHKLDGRKVMVDHCAWRKGWRCTIIVATADGYKSYTVDRWELDILAPGE
jgi:hypothetical protein